MESRNRLEVKFADVHSAQAALKALSHEGSVGNRSKSEVRNEDNLLIIEIKAQDVVALRATVNAYLRALQTIESMENTNEV